MKLVQVVASPQQTESENMMNNTFIKKAANIVGIGIIVLSVAMFITYIISYLVSISMYYNNGGNSFGFSNIVSGLIAPLSYLVSGFGFGSIVILLGHIIKNEKTEPIVNESYGNGQGD